MKVWIFKGEILEHDPFGSEKRALEGTEFHAARPRGLTRQTD